MFAVTPQIHALFTILVASPKHLYPSLAIFIASATNFFVPLLNVLIKQWSIISWNPVNQTPCKYHFEREENYRILIYSRSRPECLPIVYTLFWYFLDTPLHIIVRLRISDLLKQVVHDLRGYFALLYKRCNCY